MLADVQCSCTEIRLEQKASTICDLEQELDLNYYQKLCGDATAENQLSIVRAWYENNSDALQSFDQTEFVQTPMEYMEQCYDEIIGKCDSTNYDSAGNIISDRDGDNCDAYLLNTQWCGLYDTVDFNSFEMCCACNGGYYFTVRELHDALAAAIIEYEFLLAFDPWLDTKLAEYCDSYDTFLKETQTPEVIERNSFPDDR